MSTLLSHSVSVSSLPRELFALPSLFHRLFGLLQRIHCVWRSQQGHVQVTGDTRNFRRFLAGSAVHILVGDRLCVRIAARCVLLARAFLSTVQARERFSLCSHGTVRLLSLRHCIPLQSLHNENEGFFTRVQHIVVGWLRNIHMNVWRMSREGFFLSMAVGDLFHSLSTRASVTDESIQRFFLHTDSLTEDLVRDHGLLLREFMRNEWAIRLVLRSMQCQEVQIKVRDIRSSVERLVDATTMAVESVQGIQSTLENALANPLVTEGVNVFTHSFLGVRFLRSPSVSSQRTASTMGVKRCCSLPTRPPPR